MVPGGIPGALTGVRCFGGGLGLPLILARLRFSRLPFLLVLFFVFLALPLRGQASQDRLGHNTLRQRAKGRLPALKNLYLGNTGMGDWTQLPSLSS